MNLPKGIIKVVRSSLRHTGGTPSWHPKTVKNLVLITAISGLWWMSGTALGYIPVKMQKVYTDSNAIYVLTTVRTHHSVTVVTGAIIC